jgi:DNA-binding response OmpR family regulator
MSKKIFYLEDHAFYANVIIPRLKKQGYEVTHCLTYKSAEEAMSGSAKYDYALLDVVLTNGKTGIHFAEKYEKAFEKILFITGCRDTQTIEALINKGWNSVSKQYEIWDDLKDFLTTDKAMHISLEEAC